MTSTPKPDPQPVQTPKSLADWAESIICNGKPMSHCTQDEWNQLVKGWRDAKHALFPDDPPQPVQVQEWMREAAQAICDIENICIAGDYSDLTAKAVQPERIVEIIQRHAPPALSGAAEWNALASRIRNYLCSGGLFNPEMMEHQKVSRLLRDVVEQIDKTCGAAGKVAPDPHPRDGVAKGNPANAAVPEPFLAPTFAGQSNESEARKDALEFLYDCIAQVEKGGMVTLDYINRAYDSLEVIAGSALVHSQEGGGENDPDRPVCERAQNNTGDVAPAPRSDPEGDGQTDWALRVVHELQNLTRIWITPEEEDKAAEIVRRNGPDVGTISSLPKEGAAK